MTAMVMECPGSSATGRWRSAASWIRQRDAQAGLASCVSHAALVVALVLSFAWKDQDIQKKDDVLQAMDVSFVTERDPAPKPSATMAAPKVKQAEEKEPTADAVDQSVKEKPSQADKPSTTDGDAKPAGGPPPSPEGTIWTPPAPDPNAPLSTNDGAPAKRVVLPVVEMKKGAADPQLVSYDQGRFSDAASVHEASRLPGSGNIVMLVSVDDKGDVTDCRTSITSGSALLDQKACDLVRSYKYRPGQDADGRPKAAQVSEVLEWARDGKFASGQDQSTVDGAIRSMPKTASQAAQAPASGQHASPPLRMVTMPKAHP